TSKANIPKLDDTNFLHWSMQMKADLRHKGLLKNLAKLNVKGKKKGQRGPNFPPGKHNPEATHDTKHCWKLHPKLRKDSSLPSASGNRPTTQLVKKWPASQQSSFLKMAGSHKISIRKTTEKGANILIDNHFQLIGSLKNNLLELQSFHGEAIKSLSACYQSSPDPPNWHARLGHPNQKYQTLMVPRSKLIDCSV
ncbi:hypothetical protein VP01_3864g3, partial [Puccinia sorghi]